MTPTLVPSIPAFSVVSVVTSFPNGASTQVTSASLSQSDRVNLGVGLSMLIAALISSACIEWRQRKGRAGFNVPKVALLLGRCINRKKKKCWGLDLSTIAWAETSPANGPEVISALGSGPNFEVSKPESGAEVCREALEPILKGVAVLNSTVEKCPIAAGCAVGEGQAWADTNEFEADKTEQLRAPVGSVPEENVLDGTRAATEGSEAEDIAPGVWNRTVCAAADIVEVYLFGSVETDARNAVKTLDSIISAAAIEAKEEVLANGTRSVEDSEV
ncbi:MAG: hypothetical protein MMC23_001587 [Stictis urceolatum]|nr:hypothetical protein [Stictis urceolata]